MKEHFPFNNDWLLNDKIFKEAVKAIEKDVKVSFDYDIPYVAGYSKDGKIYYIDKDLPRHMKLKDGREIDIVPFLLLHEVIEKTLLMRFGTIYQFAHQIAFHIELDFVRACKIPEKEYNAFFNKYIKKIGDLTKYSKIPKDFDITPMEDEKDYKTLKRMVGLGRSFKDYVAAS